MDAVIINFEKIREEHIQQRIMQKEKLISDCQKEISESEDKIQGLYSEIAELQSVIDFNYRLISKINRPH